MLDHSMAVAILFIAPFFYLDMFLFSRDFFDASPIQIPIIVSFCLASCWMILTILITEQILFGYSLSPKELMNANIYIATVCIAIASVIGYFRVCGFKHFVFGAFLIYGIITTIIILSCANRNKNSNK